jgi:hypothetical protein
MPTATEVRLQAKECLELADTDHEFYVKAALRIWLGGLTEMPVKTNVVSVTLLVFKRIPDRAASVGGLVLLHHSRIALPVWPGACTVLQSRPIPDNLRSSQLASL